MDVRLGFMRHRNRGNFVQGSYYYNRPLSKLVKVVQNIINARDQIQSKTESLTSISIFVSNNLCVKKR
ncbi:hypothetical protein [Orientia tsutsugamushi]|uniref:hypothetical protein n=1 Tax=Orientia tsutsugamushi TaxID=784 RepID=UPI0013896889